ncbi:hypothetical protein Ahy_A01g002977 [Arachis hypogaea]|uniref:Uncharacterized protein n=1 Tax=Arachis hypogaea TaxID=3818 RepID=A0A445ESC1_ARAHY|nr:hypothetical protein Ahy_A01g002977 [Arachis hypogaea]
MSHFCPLHIVAVVNGFKINKVLIDGGAVISLLPERMLGKPLNIDRSLNSYNCEGCYLTSEGLSVKLRYPDIPFKPTVNDVSRIADLTAEAHCVENKCKVRSSKVAQVGVVGTFDVPGLGSGGVWCEGSGCNSGSVSNTLDLEESELVVSAALEAESESGTAWFSSMKAA